MVVSLVLITGLNFRVGRITGRLPKELGDEIVGSVLELCAPLESDGAWHGGKVEKGDGWCTQVVCVCW